MNHLSPSLPDPGDASDEHVHRVIARALAGPAALCEASIQALLDLSLKPGPCRRAFLLLPTASGALEPAQERLAAGVLPIDPPLRPLPAARLSPWRPSLHEGHSLRLPQQAGSEPDMADLIASPGLAGSIMIPLCVADDCLGVAVFWPAPPQEEPRLMLLASAIATLVARQRSARQGLPPDPFHGSLRVLLSERDEAQRRFADIAGISADWIWETDAEDRFTFLSESFYARSGRKPEQALGSSRWEVLDRYPAARASADWAWLRDRIRAREPFRDFVYKLPALPGNDKDVWIRTSGQAWFARDGAYAGYRGVSTDISELKAAEVRLQDIIEASGAGSFEVDLRSGQTTVNDRWAQIVGLRRHDLDLSDDSAWLRLMHPDDRAHALAEQERCLSGEIPLYQAEFRLRHAQGHWVSVLSHGRITRRDADGRPLRLVGANFDITALKEAQSRVDQIIRGAQIGTWEWNGDTGRNEVNEFWAAMLGHRLADFGQPSVERWRGLVHPDDLPGLLQQYDEQGRVQDQFEFVFRMRHRDGHWVWVLSRGQVMERAPDGTVSRISGIHIDISDSKAREAELIAANEKLRTALAERDAAERQLREYAMHDDLTGALNRRSFHQALRGRLAACAQGGGDVCIAMIDLVRFKSINETHGHAAGDRLLREVVRRWRFVEGRGAQVFRIGGDEFAVIMPGSGLGEQMAALIQDMRGALAAPFRLNDQSLRMEMSVGLAQAPRDGLSLDDLAANADLALFASKVENGRTRIYAPDLRQSARQRHEIVQDLLAAQVDRDFCLLYQPIVDLATDRIAGVEALLRWNHPRRGLLTPGDFIDVLCGLDLSATVGDWILRSACCQVADWNRALGGNLLLSVNVFPLQADNPGFPALVAQALAHSGLAPEALEIEVTENIAMREGSVAQKVLQDLSDMGIAFSLDDFGTGYSSLKSLLQMAPRTLKVDRSFVDGPGPCDRRLALLRSIHHLAHGLGVRTIVEGVETPEMAQQMREIGFDYGQGYHWGKPFDAEALGRLLQRQSGRAEAR